MSLPSSVSVERQIVLLYHRINLSSMSPSEKNSLRTQLLVLLKKPGLFQFLLTSPAAVPIEEWVPCSKTVMEITTCFLAMGIIYELGSCAVDEFRISTAMATQFLSVFWPRAIVWIPFIHPAYGILRHHPHHVNALTSVLPVAYKMAGCTRQLRERFPLLCKFTVSLWFHSAARLEHHEADMEEEVDRLRMLGDCVRDMISTKVSIYGRPGSSRRILSAIQDDLLLVGGTPCSILERLLRSAGILLAFTRLSSSGDSTALCPHLQVIAALAEEVLPVTRLSRRIMRNAVDLARGAYCDKDAAATCGLVLTLWTVADDDNPLIWSLRYGFVEVLQMNLEGTQQSRWAEALRYIANRTTIRSVLRALSMKVDPCSSWFGKAVTESDTESEYDVQATIRERVDSLNGLAKTTCCNSQVESSRKLLRSFSSSSLSHNSAKGALDQAFATVQVLQYLQGKESRNIIEDIVKSAGGCQHDPKLVIVEVHLDRLPPHHRVVLRRGSLNASPQTMIEVRARQFKKQTRIAVIELSVAISMMMPSKVGAPSKSCVLSYTNAVYKHHINPQ
ncbi:hypothetical protein FB107DRAFT_225360 [Schizophyllum commune]